MEKTFLNNLNKNKFALFGSSFGGYTSLIYASKNPVLALGLKAPVSNYPEVIKAKANEKETKALDFTQEAFKYNIYNLATKIKAPVLIVHGDKDDDVPLAQSQKLLKSLGGEKELSIIARAVEQLFLN